MTISNPEKKTPREWAREWLVRADLAGAEASPSDVVEVIVAEAVAYEHARCLKIAEDEPNLPGSMPSHVREAAEKALANGKLEDVCRHFAGGMQKSIAKKIREG